jgi:hypothetical protein
MLPGTVSGFGLLPSCVRQRWYWPCWWFLPVPGRPHDLSRPCNKIVLPVTFLSEHTCQSYVFSVQFKKIVFSDVVSDRIQQGLSSFLKIHTVQHRRSQHARTLTLMNTRTQTLPLWVPPKEWVPTNITLLSLLLFLPC